MDGSFRGKFQEYIEAMNFSELDASDTEQEEMILMDELFELIQDVPFPILVEHLTVADTHVLNAIADMPVIPAPSHALVMVLVLYRILLSGQEPTGMS